MKTRIEEVTEKVNSMPHMELDYINEKELRITCTYCCLRSERMDEIKEFLGLADLYATWIPCKNPKGIVLVGEF